jgi:hypothetical protein
MSIFKEQINRIKDMLNSFQVSIEPWLDEASFTDKKSQLKSIQKDNTPVPDMLRELKFQLIHELDKYKEAKEAQSLLSGNLQPYIIPAKGNNIKKSKTSTPKKQISNNRIVRIILADIIKSDLLIPGTALFRKYKNKRFEAIITKDGKLQMVLDGHTNYYTTPSGAAMAASGKPQDGWIWWKTVLNDKVIELDYYRKKFVASKNHVP